MPHRLDSLLSPRLVAVVGASAREGSVGQLTLAQLLALGFPGAVYPVNPNYDALAGRPCFADCASLPEAPDLAVFCLPDERLEAAFDAALAAGMRAATVFSSGRPADDPGLAERLRDKAIRAGVPICGPNGMGFHNFRDRVSVCGFRASPPGVEGGAVLLSHSGSVLSALSDCEDRIGWSLAVSTGNELTTGLADYMDWALARPETEAIALFMETARDPTGFAAALERADARGIPVVALKVGRSARSAELAVSHSGALAGDDAVYGALFERHGVIRVETLDEMAATLQLLTHPRRPAAGGLATMHDSGGERGLWLDLAERLGVRYGQPSPATVARLAERLDPGLPPTNPLDAWGTGRDGEAVFADCLAALAEDPDTALAFFCFDREGGGALEPSYCRAALAAAARTDKPIALVTSRHGSGSDPRDLEMTRAGLPVIDGEWWALKATRHLLERRDRVRPAPAPDLPEGYAERWRRRLAQGPLREAEALALAAEAGVPTVACRSAGSVEGALGAAEALGYPVVLKTARAGLAHKSDVGGVRLGLADESDLIHAYAEMSAALGVEVLVARQAAPGVEAALGAIDDPGFGPVVMIGSGGLAIEEEADAAFLLAPFDAATAARAIGRLRLGRRLAAGRGRPARDLGALAEAAAALSAAAAALSGSLGGLDLNPVIVQETGCLAVDALQTPRQAAPEACDEPSERQGRSLQA